MRGAELDGAADAGLDSAADAGLDSAADAGLDSAADAGLDSAADAGLYGSPSLTWLWWSSGKDSAWALRELSAAPHVKVTGLVTTLTAPFNRVSMHAVRHAIVQAQADAVGLPLHVVTIPHPCSNTEYEAAVAGVVERAREQGVERMAFGDLFLEDVRTYRDALFAGTGVDAVYPLWGSDTAVLARAMLAEGLEAWVTCVDPSVVSASLAGHRFDAAFLDALPASVDPCGENGEFHTCVVNGPMFRRPVRVEPGPVVEREGFVFADLVPRREPTG